MTTEHQEAWRHLCAERDRAHAWARRWKALAKYQRKTIAQDKALLEAHDLEAAHQTLDWLRVPRRFPASDIGDEPGTLTHRVLGLVALAKGYILTANALNEELASKKRELEQAHKARRESETDGA